MVLDEMVDGSDECNRWVDEVFGDNVRFGLRVEREVYRAKSEYQEIRIVETQHFGRVLLLDGVFMTSEYDEFLYHELMVHPALCSSAEVARVVVIGGGDGGTVREVLRHSEVKRCAMVELDEMVVRACEVHLPTAGTSWGDPRLSMHFENGVTFMERLPVQSVDVILVDGTDPVGAGASLFEPSFLSLCQRALKPHGLFAIQTSSPILMMDQFLNAQSTLQSIFRSVRPYFGPVPLYGTGVWSWTLCANTDSMPAPITERQNTIAQMTRAYNQQVHAAAFAQPNFVRDALQTLSKK
ncbi:MAG: polyamine aminopropyltransferase [Polyangiales bacterium]